MTRSYSGCPGNRVREGRSPRPHYIRRQGYDPLTPLGKVYRRTVRRRRTSHLSCHATDVWKGREFTPRVSSDPQDDPDSPPLKVTWHQDGVLSVYPVSDTLGRSGAPSRIRGAKRRNDEPPVETLIPPVLFPTRILISGEWIVVSGTSQPCQE